MKTLVKAIIWIPCLLLAVDADEIIKYKTKATIANNMVLEMTGIDNIKGEKSYSKTTTKFDIINTGIPGKPFDIISERIIRLDKSLCWELNSSSKTYSELPIPSLFESASTKPGDEYNWSFDVSLLSKNKRKGKFRCQGQIANAVGVKNIDPADSILITFEQWSAKDTLIGTELFAFRRKFALVAGIPKVWTRPQFATLLKKGYGAQIERLMNQMNKLPGIPVNTEITIEKTMLDGVRSEDYLGKGKRFKVLYMIDQIDSIKEKNLEDKMFEIPDSFEMR